VCVPVCVVSGCACVCVCACVCCLFLWQLHIFKPLLIHTAQEEMKLCRGECQKLCIYCHEEMRVLRSFNANSCVFAVHEEWMD